jgi:thermitase
MAVAKSNLVFLFPPRTALKHRHFDKVKTLRRAASCKFRPAIQKIQRMQESTMLQSPPIHEAPLKKIVKESAFAIFFLLVVIAAGAAQTAPAAAPSVQSTMIGGSPKSIRAGHILVRFKTTPSLQTLQQLNTTFGATVAGTISGIGVTHLKVAPEKQFALLENLRQRSDVQFAEFDSYIQALVMPNDTYYSTAYATSHYGNMAQWAPQAVSAPTAWGVTGGSQSTVIAVVDTGVDDTHPDLASKIVGEYSVIGGSAKDEFGHGTHVAGIAAAATDNDLGIAGICWNCSILSVKVLDAQGSGTVSDVASGITYAVQHGARVINLSLGGGSHTQTMDSALNYAVANNALPVCAMGNSGSGYNAPEPAYWYSCLTVIATDQTGARASFSNYGVQADVAAPGVAVLSTMPTYPVTLNSYGFYENYDALSGTSMATPMVSGIAGLVFSMNPNLTAAQVKGIIEASAGNGAGWTNQLAFGLVNAATAVAKANNSDTGAPVANVLLPVSGSIVSGVTTVQAAPIDDTTVHHVDIIQNDSRLMQPLVGVSTSNCTSNKKNCTTAPAWTLYWPSTVLWNGSRTMSAIATDIFGGTSSPQSISFTIKNNLVTQSGTANLCYPATSSCPNSIYQPVTTGVAVPAASHLQGTVSYGSLTNNRSASFWLQVASVDPSGNLSIYLCGTSTTTVDCYPAFLLQPDGSKSLSNSSGGQIDLMSSNSKPASGTATINWTLTYPQ